MCGIAGTLDVSRFTDATIRERTQGMIERLRHRGPDACGIWSDSWVSLGHTRLSILDLSDSGKQPMASMSGRWVITFNGEIYNFEQLRKELSNCGCRFRGSSDTEVLVNAIETWGIERTLQSANGMFAFAAWDVTSQQLYLARDRLGIKPLYFGRVAGCFAFASEVSAIDDVFHGELAIDQRSVASFMRYGYVPTPHTIFENISKLSPGTWARISAHSSIDIHQYWTLTEAVELEHEYVKTLSDEEAYLDQLDHRMRSAVRDRMVADVPIGCFLSGGIDSSLISAYMQSESAQPVRTFSIGFDVKAFDESPKARRVSHFLGTDHTEMMVSAADALALLPELVQVFDEPFADHSQVPMLLVSQLARSQVTVALSGDGGDELFCGYNHYRMAMSMWRMLQYIPYSFRTVTARRVLPVMERVCQNISHFPTSRRTFYGAIGKARRLFDAATDRELYHRLVSVWLDSDGLFQEETLAYQASAMVALKPVDFPRWMMRTDLNTYLPDDILTKVDRASMRVGLEARVPLLDHRVVGLAQAAPLSLSYGGGVMKVALKRLLARYLPQPLFAGPKQGFSIPLAEWLRGPLRDWSEEMLSEERLSDSGFVSNVVRQRWTEHLGKNANWQAWVWNVIVFQAWLDNRGNRQASSTFLR